MHIIRSIINANSGYYNLKHIKKSPCLTPFACQFDGYRFIRLPFGVAPASDMFQQKINETFKDLQNVSGIADNILIVGYVADGREYDRTLKK